MPYYTAISITGTVNAYKIKIDTPVEFIFTGSFSKHSIRCNLLGHNVGSMLKVQPFIFYSFFLRRQDEVGAVDSNKDVLVLFPHLHESLLTFWFKSYKFNNPAFKMIQQTVWISVSAHHSNRKASSLSLQIASQAKYNDQQE